jgi:hypothetical protein
MFRCELDVPGNVSREVVLAINISRLEGFHFIPQAMPNTYSSGAGKHERSLASTTSLPSRGRSALAAETYLGLYATQNLQTHSLKNTLP